MVVSSILTYVPELLLITGGWNSLLVRFILIPFYNANCLAGGHIDYGFDFSRRYQYTFSAGETCSTPDIPIPIVDDGISERNERFTISIIEDSVPFNVRLSRKSAQITIKDNDSK